VLHQIGAQDSFISRHFEAHFTRVVFVASLIGLAAAWVFFYLLGQLIDEARSAGFLISLTSIPIGAIVLSWLVTRISVRQQLKMRI